MFSINPGSPRQHSADAPRLESAQATPTTSAKRKSSIDSAAQTPSTHISAEDLRAQKKGRHDDGQPLPLGSDFHGAPLSLAPAPFMPITFNPYTTQSPSLQNRTSSQNPLPW